MRPIHIIAFAIIYCFTPLANADEPTCPPPQPLGSLDLPSYAQHTHFNDTTAYVFVEDFSAEHPTLYLVDLTTPSDPTFLGSLDLPESSRWTKAEIHNNTLYIFDRNSFHIIDITDPTSPQYITKHITISTFNIRSATIHNDYLYTGTGGSSMEITNLANPHQPIYISTKEDQDPILAVINSIGYTTKAHAVDLSDPLNPILTGNPFLNGSHYFGFHQIQNTLFTFGAGAAEFGSGAFDISNPLETRRIDSNIDMNTYGHQSFDATNSLFYTISSDRNGIVIYDASNPDDIYTVTETEIDPHAHFGELYIKDGITFISSQTSINAYKITPNPVTATRHTVQPANDIALKDNIAIICTDGGSIEFLDISDHTNPTLLSTISFPEDAISIDTVGNIAYIATSKDDLNLVDFSDPTNPTLILNIDIGRNARDVNIVNNLAYVVDRIEGLSIFDITDPTNPNLLSTTDTVGWAADITIDDANKIAYLAQGQHLFHIIDIDDPSAPSIIATITPLGSINSGIQSSTLHAGFLYTAEGVEGYRIFDVSDPTNPIELTRHQVIAQTDQGDVAGFTHQFTFDATTLYLANGTGGFLTYDATDPFNLIQTNWVQTESSIRRVQLRDEVAFTTVYEGGFRIYEFHTCPPCLADLNNDTILDFFDISLFLTAFNTQDPIADFTNDGIFDFFDITAFIQAFTQGCP